jgi:signal transduction histidine kinase
MAGRPAHADATTPTVELETVIEEMADGLAVFDAQSRLVRANQAWRTMFALGEDSDFASLPAAERTKLTNARHPDGRAITPDEWNSSRVLRGELVPTSAPMDAVITNLAGRELTLSISGASIRDAEGQVVGGVALLRDVTAQRQLERERGEVLGLVAHDLGTPLTAVKLLVQWLRRRLARGELLPADALDMLGRAADQKERLVADLRVTESLEGGHFELMLEPCDLVAVCHEAAEAARLFSQRTVTVVVPKEPVETTADRDRIGQVLANLLTNALKYSPAERPVTLTLTSETHTVRVAVRDAGPGIPPEALPCLFARFYRVPGIDAQPGAGRGLGMGLYIARELVERHGGQIGVESVVGQGSTFWFTLPLVLTPS